MTLLSARAAGAAFLCLVAWAGLNLWLGQATDIDLYLADSLFDAAGRTFPWRHAWLTETFNHGILKVAAVVLGLLAIAAALREWRRLPLRRTIVATTALLAPLITSLLKRASVSHCPWDLARYGGDQPYLRVLDNVPDGWQAGHCLPAGHASSVMWLVAAAVFFLPGQPRKALAAGAAALAVGMAVGWMQQMRGAHFLTHTLWSAWIACAVALGATLFWQSFRARVEIALP